MSLQIKKEEKPILNLNATPFIPNEKFISYNFRYIIFKLYLFSIKDRIIDPSKSIPYYPLPSNEGYEKFLQKMKKDQCKYME